MNKVSIWASAAVLAMTISAGAETTHTEGSMMSGVHQMPGPKAGIMPHSAMPSHNPKCMKEALATMPPSHRKYCEHASKPVTGTNANVSNDTGVHQMMGPKAGTMPNSSMPSHGH